MTSNITPSQSWMSRQKHAAQVNRRRSSLHCKVTGDILPFINAHFSMAERHSSQVPHYTFYVPSKMNCVYSGRGVNLLITQSTECHKMSELSLYHRPCLQRSIGWNDVKTRWLFREYYLSGSYYRTYFSYEKSRLIFRCRSVRSELSLRTGNISTHV